MKWTPLNNEILVARTPEDIVYVLLKEWDRLAEDGVFPDLGYNEDFVVDITNEIARFIRPNDMVTAGVILGFWKKHLLRETGDRLAQGIHYLLSHLDLCYSARALNIVKCPSSDPKELLAIGSRWWNERERQLTGHSLLEEHIGPEKRRFFPHLRLWPLGHLNVIPSEEFACFKTTAFKEGVRIGLCSLSGRAMTHFRPTRKILHQTDMGFVADKIFCRKPTDEVSVCSEYLRELREAVQWAKRESVDILCFPELSVCDDGRKEIFAAMEEGEPQHLFLVVAGSYHDEDHDHGSGSSGRAPIWQNISPLAKLENGKAKRVGSVLKKEAYGSPVADIHEKDVTLSDVVREARRHGCGKVYEHITRKSSGTILQTPIGLVGILICRDAIDPGADGTLETVSLLVDHLVVISMDESTGRRFVDAGDRVTKFSMGAFYYVNAAQRLSAGRHKQLHASWVVPSKSNITKWRIPETAEEKDASRIEIVSGQQQESWLTHYCSPNEEGCYLLQFDHGSVIH